MAFAPVLPGHAILSAQVEQQVGFERFVFTFRAYGGIPGQTSIGVRGLFAATLQRGIASFYATEAMKDKYHCPLPGELEEHLRPLIQQEMASSIGMCEFGVMHKAHNGDLAGLTVTYTNVQS